MLFLVVQEKDIALVVERILLRLVFFFLLLLLLLQSPLCVLAQLLLLTIFSIEASQVIFVRTHQRVLRFCRDPGRGCLGLLLTLVAPVFLLKFPRFSCFCSMLLLLFLFAFQLVFVLVSD